MYDEMMADGRALITRYGEHLPAGAVLSQVQMVATLGGYWLTAFWSCDGSDVWGTVQEKRRGDLCGQVIVSTWTPGSETPAFAVVRAADEVPA